MTKMNPNLEKEQVDDIIRLCVLKDYGAERIARELGVGAKQVKQVLQGKRHTKWTGGRLIHGKRAESVWRGGSKPHCPDSETSKLKGLLDGERSKVKEFDEVAELRQFTV